MYYKCPELLNLESLGLDTKFKWVSFWPVSTYVQKDNGAEIFFRLGVRHELKKIIWFVLENAKEKVRAG